MALIAQPRRSLPSTSLVSLWRHSPTPPSSSSVETELDENDEHKHAAFHAHPPCPRRRSRHRALARLQPPPATLARRASPPSAAPARRVWLAPPVAHTPGIVDWSSAALLSHSAAHADMPPVPTALHCAGLAPRSRASRPRLRAPPRSPARAALLVLATAHS
jgi:hypothetical protein